MVFFVVDSLRFLERGPFLVFSVSRLEGGFLFKGDANVTRGVRMARASCGQ